MFDKISGVVMTTGWIRSSDGITGLISDHDFEITTRGVFGDMKC